MVGQLADQFEIVGLSAHSRVSDLADAARQFNVPMVTITDPQCTISDSIRSQFPASTKILTGNAGIEAMVTDPRCETVVAAMVGSAGLFGAQLALEHGKPLALANKETLVVAGPVMMNKARERNTPILPVDSEHSALFQCLHGADPASIERVVLTGSGGPFREWPINEFGSITVEQALKHPTWNMGPKITIDSATMMNKALEIIEASWLFDLPADKIGVVIHPQSVIHSMVEYVDGSVLAQLSPPDMRLPIQYALTYPARMNGPAKRIDWTKASEWQFYPPDPQRYPAIELGFEVVRRRGTAGAAVNAANEIAVSRFLDRQLPFNHIVPLCQDVLNRHPFEAEPTLATLLAVDQWARQEATRWNS